MAVVYFVVFMQAMIGDRYGYRPFPTCIDAVEFEMLMSVPNLGHDHDAGVSIVRDWYQKDENAVPSCYIMQVLFIIIILNIAIFTCVCYNN